MAEDACGVFSYENENFEEQEKNIIKKNIKNNIVYYSRFQLHDQYTTPARNFFESSRFDTIANDLGYDSLFVNKTFNKIQDAITREKKIYEMFKASPAQRFLFSSNKKMKKVLTRVKKDLLKKKKVAS